jgi:hypothetical protein
MTPDTIIKRTEKVLASSIGDELVMFDAEAGKYYGLNPVASNIWSLLDEPKSINELCDHLMNKFEITRENCIKEVIEFIPRLESKGLLEVVKDQE